MNKNDIQFSHDAPLTVGVLLANLGTPDEPTTKAVRRYLKEFLWDPRVVEVSRPLWWLVLNGIILPFRSPRSARAYRKIWSDQHGSPLLHYSQNLGAAIQAEIGAEHIHVELGMSYGQPSMASALEKLKQKNINRLVVLPMYPQYSGTTTASVWDAVAKTLQSWRWIPQTRFISHYHDEPEHIEALAQHIRHHRQQNPGQKLLFSFHGIPQRYLRRGDPYHCQCHKTARLVAETLGLSDDQWGISFQSRLGREPWLQPYTDHILPEWAAAGVTAVDVICPGFAVDCLETLEEAAMEYRDLFIESGGKTFRYIPCLNDGNLQAKAMVSVLKTHAADWLDANTESSPGELAARQERAERLENPTPDSKEIDDHTTTSPSQPISSVG